jgi:hypothetical protein
VAQQEEKAVNEYAIITTVVIVGCAVFGAVWLLYQDVKKGVHARIERCENVIDDVVRECGRKKEDFITTKAFDRFEGHLTIRFDGLDKSITHLTQRVDDLVLTVRNGNGKLKGGQ